MGGRGRGVTGRRLALSPAHLPPWWPRGAEAVTLGRAPRGSRPARRAQRGPVSGRVSVATGGPSLVPRHCASRDTACESRRPVSSEAAQRVAPKAGACPRRPRLRLLAMPAGGSWGVTGRAGLVPRPFRGRVARSFPWDRGPSPRWPSRAGEVAPSPHGPRSERPGRKSQPDPRREDGPSPGEGPASRTGLLRPPSSVWGRSLPGQGLLPRTHSRQGRGLARPPSLHPGLLLAAGVTSCLPFRLV